MKQILDLLRRVHRDITEPGEVEPATTNATRAAKILGVSRRTVYAMLDDGRLMASGKGRSRRIDLDSLDIKRRELQEGKDRP